MAIPDVQITAAMVEEIVDRKLRNSDASVLIRQLQGAAVINHTGAMPMEVLGVFNVPFNLAGGAFVTTNVTVPDLTGKTFLPVGAVFYTGALNSQDQLTWAYSWPAATTVQVALHNHSAGAAVGTFYFHLLVAG